ncbi:MAG: ABC transporter ATP-binding protein [Bacteroidota bacterium]
MSSSIFGKFKTIIENLNVKRTVKLVWSIAKGWTILAIIVIALETALMVASLYSLKLLVDIVTKTTLVGQAKRDIIITYTLIAAAIGIAYYVVRAISAYISEIQAARVSELIDDQIHDIAANLELSFYESPEYFDILKRAKEAGSYRPNLVIISMLDTTKNFLSLFGASAMLISISWALLPMLVLFVVPTLLVKIYFSGKQNTLWIKNTALERKTSYLSTLITSDTTAKEVRSYHLGNYFKSQYFQIRMSLLAERLKISYNRTVGEALATVVANLGFFTCVGYIMLKAAQGESYMGNVTLFLFIFPQVFNLLQSIASGISTIYQNNIYVDSIFELFSLKKEDVDEGDTKEIPAEDIDNIELKNVNFTYAGTDKPVLTDINLSLPSGKIIAVVGLNGAGKTTLIKLLCRLYDPTSGAITMAGQDIRNFSKKDYRKQISVVFQDFCKYNFSAADNIRFGDIERDEHKLDDIIEAAKHSGAHSYIKDFEKQYDTMMGRIFEDGHEISIGQWQKLATARAFYSNSRFLILDEATSALDAVAEKELFDSFRQHIGNRAALIISHRHSAVKHADYIYVLSNGRIMQQGTDAELLAMEGDYSKLFKKRKENK